MHFPLAPQVQITQTEQMERPGVFSIQNEMARISKEKGFITFYDEKDPLTEWLGNFYPTPVEYNGLVFQNSEAAFQAQKFIHHPELMIPFTTLSGDQAFKKARSLSGYIDPEWMGKRVHVMKEVVKAKIETHPHFADWLIATNGSLIVEHNPVKGRDTFWSDDFDGTGQNMLGKVWMEIRAELQDQIDTGYSSFGWHNYWKFIEDQK